MRGGGAVCSVLIVLCCAGCGAGTPFVLPKNNFAFGEPAGFYPGRSEGHLESEYSAWLTKNQVGIADIQKRIVEIKNGARVPGCIGEDKYTCVATLSQRMTVADDWANKDSNVFPEIKYDVNGKPVNGSLVMLSAYRPNGYAVHDGGQTQLMLDVAPNGSVSHIMAMLPSAREPLVAQTQEDYDRTHVYDIVAAVTAKTCPALTSSEVARWIENVVKPTVAYEKETKFDDGMTTGRSQSSHSKKIVFCGRTFSFNSSSGYYRQGFSRMPYEGAILDIE